jgi:uncharacterized protein YdiU (UPF0061 family)
MDAYHPATVFSSIDRMGRYAYANQPQIAQWNLARLAETLLPLLADEEEQAIAAANDALGQFPERYARAHRTRLLQKLGLFTAREDDDDLIQALFTAMADNQVDFTLFFRRLADAALPDFDAEPLRSLFVDPTAGDAVLARWRTRIADDPRDPAARREAMRAVNPAFIPRNHRVEAMIAAAVDNDDFAPFDELLAVLARPYDDQPEFARYADPPLEHERVLATFCGT